MIIEKSMHPEWLSNTWLVADKPGGKAILIDTGGPMDPILQSIERLKLEPEQIFCTHHHYDHVENNQAWQERYGCPICGHGLEEPLFGTLDRRLEDGDEIRVGDLFIRALHIPGHTLGQMAFLIDDRAVFTGDTLFQGSIGGTRAPGHTSFEDIRHSIMEILMQLPKDTAVYPGHMEPTTIQREWEENPFIQYWRGEQLQKEVPIRAFDRPATLLLEARDYDGGTKCQVRFEDDHSLDIVPGSRVTPADGN
jgi:hydroxyacylglutathione hydrolase